MGCFVCLLFIIIQTNFFAKVIEIEIHYPVPQIRP